MSRLAFSVAAHLDPDVLIADEVLSVGDAEFQRKSLGEMRTVAEGGRTVIFVSHNHALVTSLCTRAIWLEQGPACAPKATSKTWWRPMPPLRMAASATSPPHRPARQRTRSRREVSSASRAVRSSTIVAAGRPARARRPVRGRRPEIGRLVVSVTIETLLRERIATVSNALSGDALESVPGAGELVCSLEGLPLNEGDYMCTVKLEVDGLTADHIADTTRFHVNPTGFFPGRAYPGARSGALLLQHGWRRGE